MSAYRLGTRKSALAVAQSRLILEALRSSGLTCELIPIETSGDRDTTTPLYQMDSEVPGVFVKQLELALVENRIDLAVHSLKDLPTSESPGLQVVAIPRRESPEDILIVSSKAYDSREFIKLRRGARVGTSSLRREAQCLALRDDLEVVPVRGNVNTRIGAVQTGKLDAVVLAKAGIVRLQPNLDTLTTEELSDDLFVSAPGQGALAVQTREKISQELETALLSIHDKRTAMETRIERQILKRLEGGCTLPLGVRCRKAQGLFNLNVFIGCLRRMSEGHKWRSFHRFDISEHNEQALIDKVVCYCRELLDAE